MSRPRVFSILALFSALGALAQAAPAIAPAQPSPAPLAADNAPRYAFRGVVLGVYPEKGALLIKHEDVPGLMKGMKMAFRVDAAVCARVKEGDTVTATLIVREDDFWLEDVATVKKS